MAKRMIIVENCKECPDSTLGFLMGRKRVCARMFAEECVCPDDGTPDWCPLPKLPEKKWIDPHDVDMFDHGENHGWNACLDAIIGGEEDG